EALENAISIIKEGTNTKEIGREIESVLNKRGFKPIQNLSGHGLGRYLIHVAPSIPNCETKSGVELKEGDIIAIEPFVTYGEASAYVTELDRYEIFSFDSFEPTRNKNARKLIERIFNERKTLPFAERHYVKTMEDKIALFELVKNGSLIAYPVLREKTRFPVSQFEHTVIVGKDAAEVVF
ncbi:MAG: M24 family metallopeptidase, partial [Candidatus Micrarchaeota archaeon]|nr:M24 family metallopeptidase [Candidatus Micrarchaeota archaeon]